MSRLPDEHWFASMIHERSRIVVSGGLHMLDRREGGVSHVTPSRDRLIMRTDDRLDTGQAPMGAEMVRWLEAAEAPDAPDDGTQIRSIERRVWVLSGGRSTRLTQRFHVLPGVGITDPGTRLPVAGEGDLVRQDDSLLFLAGSSATLMHELAGHRSESVTSPSTWPEWLAVVDDPLLTPWAACGPDDTGAFPGRTDLTREAPAAWRRFRAIDAPQRRMTTVVVSCRADAPWNPPPDCVEISAIGNGSYDPDRDVVSFTIFDGFRVRAGTRIPLRLPQQVSISAVPLIGRLAGARGGSLVAPGVICGSHGSEVPVGSIGCDLLVRGA